MEHAVHVSRPWAPQSWFLPSSLCAVSRRQARLEEILARSEEVAAAWAHAQRDAQPVGDVLRLSEWDERVIVRVELHNVAGRVLADRIPPPRPSGGRIVAGGGLAGVAEVRVARGDEHAARERMLLKQPQRCNGARAVADQHRVGLRAAEAREHERQPDRAARAVRVGHRLACHLGEAATRAQPLGKPCVPVGVRDVVAPVAWHNGDAHGALA
eukprot:CAMPEP_0119364446 /NCGR_PEP_ID=MMETSP1334-20130426/11359_1 /TAXON_ID=127549 /ORGANISM="Calcidiscus leptoporus, Strain RCC1130" /LENGTH=212 /DNA_ID=CAMNT_0007380155 /DNA_START=102 /DNA_END=736 /DNA_ORIENTATION=+